MMQPPYGSSYDQLLAQIRKHVRDQKIGRKIFALLQDASDEALEAQNVVLSRAEKERLSQTIMKELLDAVLQQINDGENA